ncbi:YitT family protein [Collinsella sp. zg1085]|uniref:YitT family protein n=1 Tax=Collinsella sp. zg1085 TaxID=2844380 RepID=UPI001C0AEBFD|nr:YitT family protein [Collinsella sp. zg1085]QWT17685.1 YitT family protein [Collinsella sp. zg1085]
MHEASDEPQQRMAGRTDDALEPLSSCHTAEEAEASRRLAEKRSARPVTWQFFGILNIGIILTAIAIVLFKSPNGFAFGGTSGFSIVLSKLLPGLPVGAFMWIINIGLVILGLIFLDRRTVGWSVFASFALSGYVSLFEFIFPHNVSLTGDMWLDLCFAVILPALGSAIVFDIGASTGGTDILAMILNRRSSLEIGKALMAVDVAIVLVAAVLYGPRVGLYCILGLFAKTMLVDGAIESLHLRKMCTVICKDPRAVEQFIVKDLSRSATITPGYGAYSGKRVMQVMSVLSRREAMKLKRYVRELDPGAFITIVNSSEIIGRGFRGLN